MLSARKFSILVLALIGLLILSVSASAQRARQQGYVKDESGNPVSGISVSFDRLEGSAGNNHLTEVTDDAGIFVFSNISGGMWKLEIMTSGYEPYSKICDLSSFSRNKTINIILKKTGPTLSETKRSDAKKSIANGEQLMAEGKYDEAIEVFKLFYEEYPESHLVNLFIGDAYLAKEDRETAIQYYQAMLANEPDEVSALKKIGDIYVIDRDYEKAHEYYSKIGKLETDDAELQFIAAEVANSAGDYAAAVVHYKRYIELEPASENTVMSAMAAGYILAGDGKCDEAEEYFNKALELFPDESMKAEFANEVERCRK